MRRSIVTGSFTLLLFLWSAIASAQQVPDTIGDIDAPVDTAIFYKKLFDYSKDRKVIYFLYRTIFNPPVRTIQANKKKQKVPAISVKKYKGRVIRKINILSLDPFGTSINDTSKKAHSIVQKGGNHLHIASQNRTIKNYLLFKENDKIDPLKLEESERLLRNTSFIRDAKIIVEAVPGTRDSFDIFVISQDYWSIRPDITITSSRVRYRITENNLLGWGHKFDNRVTDKYNEASPLILDGSYTVPTIGRTYISPVLYYGTAPDNNIRGIELTRPFFSPLTRVAGGVEFLSLSESDSISFRGDDSVYSYKFRTFVADAWLGYSIPLIKGETNEERSTRLIGALRFARARFPSLEPDNPQSREYFSRSDFYLASLSLSSRKYTKERYVFKFGEIEDVPDGNKITFTTGIEDRFTGTHYYYGIDGAIGRFIPSLGYIYFGAGYNTFLKDGHLFRSAVSTNVIYFSPLAQIGKWRVRQFGSFDFIYGVNRKDDEILTLNNEIGVPGYKSDLPEGTSRMVFTSQSVFYTPYVFLGFRFAPILIAGVGMVGNYNGSVLKSKVYQMYGLGLLVKNELLVLNTFQVILALYPVLPDGGSDLRFNPVKLNESRFLDFETSRPDVASYR